MFIRYRDDIWSVTVDRFKTFKTRNDQKNNYYFNVSLINHSTAFTLLYYLYTFIDTEK